MSKRPLRRRLALACGLVFLAQQCRADTFFVTNTADSGSGSLRQAVLVSNATGGSNLIQWTNGSGGALTLTPPLPGIDAGTTLDVTGAPSALTIAGAGLSLSGAVTFQNGSTSQDWTVSSSISGAGSLAKTGSGRLILTGADSYAGGTFLNAGTLGLNSDSALGSGGLTLSGGTLQTLSGLSSSRNVTLAAGGAIDAFGQASTFSGVFSGSGTLTLTDSAGGGQLTLSGANAHSGGTIIDGSRGAGLSAQAGAAGALGAGRVTLRSAGGHADLNLSGFDQGIGSLAGDLGSTLELGGAQMSVGSDGTNTTYAGTISGAGSLVKTGGGVLALTQANTYGGGTTVNGGEIAISQDGALGSGAVTLDGGGLQTSTSFTSALNLTLGPGGGAIDTSVFGSTFTGAIGGAGALTVTGAGSLTLTHANAYGGGTMLSGGVLSISNDNNLGVAATTLTFTGGALKLAAGSLNISRTLQLNAGGGTVDTAGFDSTISGLINGPGGLAKVGGGTLTISALNTYTGGTSFNGGVVSVSTDGNLGAATGGLSFNGGSLMTTGDITSVRGISLNAGATFYDQGHTLLLIGGIGGSGSLAFANAGAPGVITLTGSSSYSGGTLINGETVNINNDAALGSGVVAFNGGTLQTASTVTLANAIVLNAGGAAIDTQGNASILSGAISGSGALTTISTATLSLTGTNSYTGGTVISSGILNVNSDAALGIGGVGVGTVTFNGGVLQAGGNLVSSRPFVLNGASGGTFDTNFFSWQITGSISGAGSLVKVGAGVLTLGASNSYAGNTFVNGGTLQLGIDGALPGTTGLTVTSGGTFDLQSFAQTVASYSGAGTLMMYLRPSGSNLTVTGNAAFTGGTLNLKLSPQVALAINWQDGITQFSPISYGPSGGTTFANIVSPAAFSFTQVPGTSSMTLVTHFVPFAHSAINSNQAAVGQNLEPLRNGPTGDLRAVISNLYTLDARGLAAALDQIGPISLAGMAAAGRADASAQVAALSQRMAALADGRAPEGFARYTVNGHSNSPGGPLLAYAGDDLAALGLGSSVDRTGSKSPWGCFVSGIGTTGRLSEANSSSGLQPGYAFSAGGMTGGADYRLNPNLVVGASAGYLYSHASVYAPGSGTVDNNSAHYGLYGIGFNERARASLYLGGASDFFSTHRGIQFADISRVANAKPTGNEFNADASASFDLKTSAWGIFSPFAGLDYNRLMIGAFQESGADSLDLGVSGQTAESLLSSLGLRYSQKLEAETFSARPYLSLGWRHEFLDQSRPIEAQLVSGAGSVFSVATGGFARDGTLFGAGCSIDWGKGLTARADYAGDFRSHFQDNNYNLSLRYKF